MTTTSGWKLGDEPTDQELALAVVKWCKSSRFAVATIAARDDQGHEGKVSAIIALLDNGKRKYAIYEHDIKKLTPQTYKQAHCTCGDQLCQGPTFAHMDASLDDPTLPFPTHPHQVN